MKVCNTISGNIFDKALAKKLAGCRLTEIMLDRWTAQKSRFVARDARGEEYAVRLARNTRLHDGDIIFHDSSLNEVVVVRVDLDEVMVIDLCPLLGEQADDIIHSAVALGHALGNQHWPAVVKGCRVYVPLTMDRRVMSSVMQTHDFEHITFSFMPAKEIVPYMTPHEIRRLFGGAEHHTHHHTHHHTQEDE